MDTRAHHAKTTEVILFFKPITSHTKMSAMKTSLTISLLFVSIVIKNNTDGNLHEHC